LGEGGRGGGHHRDTVADEGMTLGARDEADAFDRAEVRNVLLLAAALRRLRGVVGTARVVGDDANDLREEETEGAGGEKGGARMEGCGR
jgi:hypothetical protein